MIETNDVRQSLVLLYKGFLLRKRHYIVTTIFEIVLPVFIASIPAIIQSELHSDYADDVQGPQQMNVSTFPPFEPFEFKGYVRKDLKMEFVYTPSNEVSQKLMTAAVSLWDQKANTSFNITLKGVDREDEMETYCLYKLRSSSRQIMIGTVFQNFISKKGQLPSSLEYKIRYGDSDRFDDLTFYTEKKYRVNGPQKYNGFPCFICFLEVCHRVVL
ncbi:uncharacterized protein LOC118204578 isoform X2 [Stegodyphus dumicola]|uniref:uncharacterized protein LOC118204578 isoform X2 n=1 Tax=Stegodyphus dumicola TaxID=202533 RepID=UPI0015B1FF04|nr:uncharacterized protein LOC118204578 isoform X2 [Stegodyphus dumicola]